MIYEGTNGIQALDLVGRKLTMHRDGCYKISKKSSKFLSENKDNEKYPHLLNLSKMLLMKLLLQRCG